MGKILDEDKIKHYSSSEYLNKLKYENINIDISKVYELLNLSKKPILLVGYGVRLSRYEKQILKLIKKLKIPVLTSRRGSDLIESSDPLYFGRPGVYGNRYSNFILQKTDLLISIGSRLSIPLIGRNYRNFAKNAKKIIVDVDIKELNKKTIKADLKLNYSSDIFIEGMIRKNIKVKSFKKWLSACKIIKKEINIKLEKYQHNTNINPYLFVKDLSKIIPSSSLILMDGGAIMNYTMQCFEIKKNQRLITSSGLDNEGFALAASLGLTSENYKNLSIVLCEESSFYAFSEYIYKFVERAIPIKIFCFSGIKNLTLRNSQRDFFNSRYVATKDNSNKYNIINNKKLYKDLNFVIIKSSKNYKSKIKSVLGNNKPSLIFIEVDQKHEIKPKMGFSINYSGKWTQNSLENMYPELDKKIVDKIMRI